MQKRTQYYFMRSKFIKILTIPIVLLLIITGIILWEVFIPKGYLHFSTITFPDDLRKHGISENYIKHEIINSIQSNIDSASIKVNQIFPSDREILDIKENTPLVSKVLRKSDKIFEEHRFQIGIKEYKFSYGELVKFLRKKVGKRDVYINISFIKDRNKLFANASFDNFRRVPRFKEFSISYDSLKVSLKEAFKILCDKISIALAEEYDHFVSILSDYNFSISYDADSKSWKHSNYSLEDKKKILTEIAGNSKNKYQAKWSNLLLASISQEISFSEKNKDALSESIKFYSNALLVDTFYSDVIRSNINLIKDYSTGNELENPYLQLLQAVIMNNKKAGMSDQILLCYNKDSKKNEASLVGFERKNDSWVIVFPEVEVNIGTKGFAEFQKKIEGDMKIPTGVFPIGYAFGYKRDIVSKMPFIVLTNNHIWITDPESPKYNQIITDQPQTPKYEKMIEPNRLNKYGIIINYNMNPVQKGKGSAITIHIQRRKKFATAGCISLDESNIKKLIEWIDPTKKPIIAMGTINDLKYLRLNF